MKSFVQLLSLMETYAGGGGGVWKQDWSDNTYEVRVIVSKVLKLEEFYVRKKKWDV